jgi:glucosyl-3-phosphoglycerate synthase
MTRTDDGTFGDGPIRTRGAVAITTSARRPRVSVCLPAHDEAATIGVIVEQVDVLRRAGVVDEVVVADDASSDGTGTEARRAGAEVVRLGVQSGKGAAMRHAAAVTSGEIVVFLDADVSNFGPHYVTRLLVPMQADSRIQLVKGFYQRPYHGLATEGGRVTELLARPVLEVLAPAVATLRQPLAGECALTRAALDAVELADGYAVDIALVLDVAARFGPEAIRQVDLGVRCHRNRPLRELGVQARAVLGAVLDRTVVPLEPISEVEVMAGV